MNNTNGFDVVYLLEMNPSGHRLVYAALIVEECKSAGLEVCFVGSEESVDNFLAMLSSASPNVRTAVVGSSATSLSELSESLGVSSRDLLLVPDGDQWLFDGIRTRFARGRPRVRLLVMQHPAWEIRGSLTPPTPRLFKSFAKLSLIAFARYAMPKLDVYQLTYPRARGESKALRRWQIEDPVLVEQCPVVKPNMPFLDPSKTWVGIVGGISRRKNPLLVGQSVCFATASQGAKIGLALLGPVQTDAREQISELVDLMKEADVELVIDDRPRTNSEMNGDVASLDIIAMAYSTHAPNSTAGKAAYYGKPILAAGSHSFRGFVEKISGADTTRLDPVALSAKLATLLAEDAAITRRDFAPPGYFGRRLLAR